MPTLNDYEYQPPSSSDSRSPCPALNALANHGILPRDGHDISALQLISALREHYRISLPLAIVLTLGGTLLCGRHFKLDLHDLAQHNKIEHDGSLTHANTVPGDIYAPVKVDKHLLEHLLNVSKDPDFLTSDDLVTFRAIRDATLPGPLGWVHTTIARGEIALASQTLGDERGNIPKQYIREWFGENRLPLGWFGPVNTIGLWKTSQIAKMVGQEIERRPDARL